MPVTLRRTKPEPRTPILNIENHPLTTADMMAKPLWMRLRPLVVAVIGGSVLSLAALGLVPAPWWSSLATTLTAHTPTLVLAVPGVGCLILGWILHRHRKLQDEAFTTALPPQQSLRPIPPWTILAGGTVVAVITVVATWALQGGVPTAGGAVERAQLRVETIRTGLSIGAGVAAVLALVLALRRQQLAERTQQATEYDAAERRITELYVKAADQLGSEKAPVRLAGLYALERLAQDNPMHRQSIVDVLCAYLRMPYLAPERPGTVSGSVTTEPATDETHVPSGDSSARPEEDSREERQVRLTAQRILARHLKPGVRGGRPDPIHWGPVILDLTEAVLIDFDMTGCHLHRATFDGAAFIGEAGFDGARFTGDAEFDGATFADIARFNGATFSDGASFGSVVFRDGAWFAGATFTGSAMFASATFRGTAVYGRFSGAGDFERFGPAIGPDFAGSMFRTDAVFGGATFSGRVAFGESTFSGDAVFDSVVFGGDAWFGSATFRGDATFARSGFGAGAWFDRATFDGKAWFSDTTFEGDAWFGGTSGDGEVWFDNVVVNSNRPFPSLWPEGWHLDQFGKTLFPGEPPEKPQSI